MNSAPFYNQANSNWTLKAFVFSLAGTLSAALTGLVLGLLGSTAPLQMRVAVASLLTLSGVVVGLLSLTLPRFTPLQCDRETPQKWLFRGPIVWALWNGASLGFGATSRLGFWVWYVVPIGSFLVGHPFIGALFYGMYGLVRCASVWARLVGPLRRVPSHEIDLWLLQRNEFAKKAAATYLIFLSLAIAVSVGL